MNKIFIYLYLTLFFYNLSFSNILSMEIKPTDQAKTGINQQVSIKECANQFIHLLNSNQGQIILNYLAHRNNQVKIFQDLLNITNNAEQVIQTFELLHILYINKEIILLDNITSELKIAFIDSLAEQIRTEANLAFELKETFQKIETEKEEVVLEKILLIFSDLIGYENVRKVIGREIISRTNLYPFEEFEIWRQNRWCVIL